MDFCSVATRLARGAFFVLSVYVLFLPAGVSADWSSRSIPGPQQWGSVTVSSDGTKVAGTSYDGYIFTSSDSGVTWTRHVISSAPNLQAISSSADGQTIAAATNGGYIYISTDGGTTWATSTAAGSRNWYSVHVSNDGSKIFAGVELNYIYVTSDGGATWTPSTNAGTKRWYAIDASDDATKLVAVGGSNIFTSTDSGTTWATTSAPTTSAWWNVSSSGDGQKLVASQWGGEIYTSTDGGANWTDQVAAGNRDWSAMDSSNDGSVIFATESYGSIYVSTDSGSTWTPYLLSGIPEKEYYGIAVSDSGAKAVAVVVNGFAYTTTDTGANWTMRAAAPIGSRIYSSEYSGDGSVLVVTSESPGSLFVSADHGATWSVREFGFYEPFPSVAMSDDGTRIAVHDEDCRVYTSSDSGATWTEQIDNSVCIQEAIASSDDGMKLVGVGNSNDDTWISDDGGATWTGYQTLSNALPSVAGCCSGTATMIVTSDDGQTLWTSRYGTTDWLYKSTDRAQNWTTMQSAGYRSWAAIAMSADATHLAGATHNGYIFISHDGGSTWATSTAGGQRWWQGVTISNDGQTLGGVVSPGYVYITTDGGATWTPQDGSSDPGSRSWPDYTDFPLAMTDDGSRFALGGWNDETYWTYPAGAVYTAPDVSTAAASGVTGEEAALNGSIDDLGSDAPTTRGFVYGLTTAYGATTTENNGGGFSTGSYSTSVSSLTCASTYHFAAYVTNGTETVYGSDLTFDTSACASGGGGSGGGGGIKISLSNLFGLGNDDEEVPAEEGANDSLIDNILDIFGNNDAGDAPTSNAPAATQGGQGGGAKGESNNVSQDRDGSRPVEPSGTEAQPSAAPIEPPALLPSRLPSDAGRLLSALGGLGAATLGFMRSHDQELAITTLSLGSLLWLLRYSFVGTGLLLRAQNVTDFIYIVRGGWNRFLSFVGARTKRRHWGTVYDSDSKQALDPALVELLDADTQAVLEQSFTDIQGKYGFLDRVGAFVIRARKTNYSFPSHKVTGDNDMMYENIYHGERFSITGVNDEAITPNIPMDQIATDWNQEEKKRMGLHRGLKMDAFISDVSSVIFWVGYALSLATVISSPHLLNGILAVVYTLMVGISTYWPTPRLWGQLKSARRSVSGLTVVLRHPQQLSTIVSRAQTDAQGRFFLKATPGDYQLDVMTRNELMEVSLLKREVRVKEEGVVNETVKI